MNLQQIKQEVLEWLKFGVMTMAMLVCILLVYWFIGNIRYVHSGPTAADAAGFILGKYYPEPLDGIAIEVADVTKGFPGAIVDMRVKRGTNHVAQITVRGFLGFGWQERTYELLE
jgi:hypothetical protein